MTTVAESIDVDVPLASAEEGWGRFAEWVLVGNYRLLCDALTCERMTDGETVRFAELDPSHSRITVQFEFDDASSPDPVEKGRRITTRLVQDLMHFREFLKQDFRRHKHKPAERNDAAVRRGGATHPRLTSDSFIKHDDDDTLGSPHRGGGDPASSGAGRRAASSPAN